MALNRHQQSLVDKGNSKTKLFITVANAMYNFLYENLSLLETAREGFIQEVSIAEVMAYTKALNAKHAKAKKLQVG